MSLIQEIKRRKVFQVAAMYAVVAWLLIEITTTVEEPLNLPAWVDTVVIVLLAIGFPVALILSWAFDVTPEGIKSASEIKSEGSSAQSSLATFTYVSQGLILLAVAFLVVDQYLLDTEPKGTQKAAVSGVVRYNSKFPDGEELLPVQGVSIAISPDGARIAYVGQSESSTQLWIRERDQLNGIPLPGSEGAVVPFFAPDGQGIGFITENRELKVVSRIGDPPLTIVEEGVYRFGGAWGVDGYVYFSSKSGLMRQAETGGGVPMQVTNAKPEGSVVIYHGWPDMLPNGKGALFTIMRDHLTDEVAVVDFSTGEIRVLAEGELGRYAASGHLVCVREDGALVATPFDMQRLSIAGPEVLLNEQLAWGNWRDLALSANGTLLYTKNNADWQVVWVDHKGTWTPVDPDKPMRGIRYVALSPDNSRLAVNTWPQAGSDRSQVWIKKLPQGPFAQLTFEGIVNMRPSWSPDGQSVVFISDRGENRDAWVKRFDGTTPAAVLLDEPTVVDEAFYSLDEQWLVYRRGKEDGGRDIYAKGLGFDGGTIELIASDFDEVAPALSADSRWLAYVSRRGGKANVYVRPFPTADAETLVSANGGTEPVWSRTQSELYYRNGDGEMVAVSVLPGPRFETGPERVLFSADAYRSDFYHAAYDVSNDGQRFVMIRVSETGSLNEELIVVENWFEELKRLAPTN
ncbi:MAG: hypothetical protein P8Y74_16635 [Desulfobacterales bacterium]